MTLRRRGVYHHWRRIETHERGDRHGVGHNELLIREGLANRNRDKLLLSVKFGGARDPALGWIRASRRAVRESGNAQEGLERTIRLELGRRSGSSQRAALVVAHRLLDFLPRVHHEWSVLHDGFTQRMARE